MFTGLSRVYPLIGLLSGYVIVLLFNPVRLSFRDGFRCLLFRDKKEVYLQSKAGQPLARYFPDVVEALAQLPEKSFVVDGELVIPVKGKLSFDELQLRLHPAASRVKKLAAAHPATQPEPQPDASPAGYGRCPLGRAACRAAPDGPLGPPAPAGGNDS